MRLGGWLLWLGFYWLASGHLWSQSSGSAQEAFGRGTALYRAGDFDGAIREYRAALALDPANFESRSNLGVALTRIGHYEEAIAVYRQALENAPPAATTHLRTNLALAYYKSGQISEAASLFEEVRKQLPDDLQVTLLSADCYLRLGNLDRVIGLLSPIASAHPGDPAVNYMLGMALIRSGNMEKGQALVDSILRDSESAEAHFLLGSVAFMAKDYPGAVKEFSKAISINPDLPSLQSYYGQALLFTGDPDGATTAFRKQLASDPNDYDSNLGLAQILFQRRVYAETRPLYERALRVRPGSAEAAYGLAALDLAERNPEQARRRLEEIVVRWPSYAQAHRALSTADEELGRKQEAARERAAAAKLDGGEGSGGIPLGSAAPDFTLLLSSGDRRVRLSEFRGKRPVVLVLGSYTCPKFRSQTPALNALYERYHDRAEFLLVYIREAHGAGSWQSTINQREGMDLADAATFEQKRGYAASCLRKLKIPYTAAVDPLDNGTEKAYVAWPSRVYLVDKQGHVAFNSLLDELNFDASSLDAALQSAIAR
jgi:tetratricopeptide (TPR) repeat protein